MYAALHKCAQSLVCSGAMGKLTMEGRKLKLLQIAHIPVPELILEILRVISEYSEVKRQAERTQKTIPEQ